MEAVAGASRVPGRTVDPDAPIEQFALDSLAVTTLVTRLSDWFGWAVSTAVLYEQRTLTRVAEALARLDATRASARAPSPAAAPAAAAAPATAHIQGTRDLDTVRAYWRHHFGVSA